MPTPQHYEALRRAWTARRDEPRMSMAKLAALYHFDRATVAKVLRGAAPVSLRQEARDAERERRLRADGYWDAEDAAAPGGFRQPAEAPSWPQDARTAEPYTDPPAPLRTLSETLRATGGPSVRGAAVPGRSGGEPTLRHLAVQCRDAVKAGLLTADDLVRVHRVDVHNAALLVEFIRQGYVDGEQASEAPPPAYTGAEPGNIDLGEHTGSILVIGDTHVPFEHPGYLDFCRRVRDRFRCDLVVHAGDEADNHALSYHESDPDGFSAGHEAHVTVKRLKAWYEAFPEVILTSGNHSALPYRKAFSAGLPRRMLRSYEEIWEAPPAWRWCHTLTVNGVRFRHGSGKSGKNAALNWAISSHQPVVIGHIHSWAGVQYQAGTGGQVWGMNVGCGVDVDAYAARYGINYAERPVLSCGVLIDGRVPLVVPMP